jgi:hypothetical protein
MKKTLFFTAIAAAVLTTGCSKENGAQPAEGDAKAIVFRGVVDKATRATAVGSTTELTSFFVHGGVRAGGAAMADLNFISAPVYKEGSAWTYAPTKYYPSNGDAVNFYAYAPVKDVNMATTGVVVANAAAEFGYTVPANQKVDNTAVDLLVASALNQVAQTTPTAVAFTFDHALSAVSFSAANRNATTGAGSEMTYVIHDISITKLDNTGTFAYPFSATSWTPAGTKNQTYVAGIPEAGVALEAIGAAPAPAQKLLSANDLMMVLPQAVTAGTLKPDNTPLVDATFVEVTYSLKDGSGAPIFSNAKRQLTLPANFKFEAGKRYNFEFDFGSAGTPGSPNTAISFDVTQVNNWADINQVIPQ